MSEKLTIIDKLLRNYKKIIALLFTVGLVAGIIAISISGFQCGKFSKTAVDIKDLRK